MKKKKLPRYARWSLGICAVLIAVVLYFPFWQIQLDAPQYPEGLVLKIYAHKLAGDVEIINGLNHYIGMKTLHAEDFMEFTVLPYIIGCFSVLLLAAGIVGKRRWLNIICVLFICFGVVAMIDFWKWNYNYGHNLDPNAAIVVPGMAYQPPIFGYKKLLNFGAFSIPDIGGWLFIGVGIVLLTLVVLTNRRPKRKIRVGLHNFFFLSLFVVAANFTSCNTKPQPIKVGEQCSFCKMPYNDIRFGGEIITKKGRVFKFDDFHCVQGFIREGQAAISESYHTYFVNFAGTHELIPADQAMLLKSESFRSPMNSNIAAFDSMDSLQQARKVYPGEIVTWKN